MTSKQQNLECKIRIFFCERLHLKLDRATPGKLCLYARNSLRYLVCLTDVNRAMNSGQQQQQQWKEMKIV